MSKEVLMVVNTLSNINVVYYTDGTYTSSGWEDHRMIMRWRLEENGTLSWKHPDSTEWTVAEKIHREQYLHLKERGRVLTNAILERSLSAADS